MRPPINYARRVKGEAPRARTTFAIHAQNYAFLRRVAQEKGVSMNAAINMVLAVLRQARSERKPE
jgi:hypothetical protein